MKGKTCENLLVAIGAAPGYLDQEQNVCVQGAPAEPDQPADPPLQSPCNGDSGGPLVFSKGSNRNTPLEGSPEDDRLVGVTSWCGFKGVVFFGGGGVGGPDWTGLGWAPCPLQHCTACLDRDDPPAHRHKNKTRPQLTAHAHRGAGCGIYKGVAMYSAVSYYRRWTQHNLDAQPSPCPPDGKEAVPTAKRVGGRNWYGTPDVTVLVDKKDGYKACERECLERAASGDGCKAFQVTYT